ncbi:MAG: hypothetical protein KHY83_02185 [Coriobacteriia bacterium]|nr:hypothetical protein [Coriobacteriia bacterium]MBS5477462.1 hypothetical protein [Coriobacteriia bacterium]
MRKLSAGLTALALAGACVMPTGMALADEGGKGASDGQGQTIGQALDEALGSLGALWNDSVEAGRDAAEAAQSTLGDYVNIAVGGLADAWDAVAASWPEVRDALSEVPGQVSAAFESAMDGVPEQVASSLEQAKDATSDFLNQVAVVRVSDPADESSVVEISDKKTIRTTFNGLQFLQWRATSDVPEASAAQTRVSYIRTDPSVAFDVAALDAAVDEVLSGTEGGAMSSVRDGTATSAGAKSAASDSKDGSSVPDIELLAFTTYRDSDVVTVSFLGTELAVSFTVPQVDVDLLNGLAG